MKCPTGSAISSQKEAEVAAPDVEEEPEGIADWLRERQTEAIVLRRPGLKPLPSKLRLRRKLSQS